MNLIKTTITRLSHTLFYNKLKKFMNKAIKKFSIISSIEAIWLFFKNTMYMGHTKAYSKILYSKLCTCEPWNIDTLRFSDNVLEITGWAIAPQGNHFSVSFTINNEDFDQVNYPSFRKDIRDYFWYYPHAGKSGFYCRKKLTKEEAFANGSIVFKYINKETKQPINNDHSYYYYEDNLILPDAKRRERVHGYDNEAMFRFVGYTIYAKLELILKEVFNKSYNDFSNILDWGCGCGRIARYFKNLKNTSFSGIDIDSDNINWCNEYLRFGNFLCIPLHPPTSLADSRCDLLIGISVFTHLGEREQFEWLGELRRVSADGAILLMTIHSNANVYRSNFDLSSFNLWWKEGIYVINLSSPDLEAVIDETDYYKTTFHTHSYIKKNWSKYFEIVDIIPACIGNVQDLVILRKI